MAPRAPRAKRPKASHALPPDRGSRYLCKPCGAIFARYIWAATHSIESHGGGRIEVCLELPMPFVSPAPQEDQHEKSVQEP